MVQKRRQKRQRRYIVGIVAILVGLIALAVALAHSTIPVLQPAGPVGAGERRLMIWAVVLGLLIVVPVFTMTFLIAFKYREHKQARYEPDWDHSRLLETIWWLIPTALIAVLAVITWFGAYQYDPYKPLASNRAPINVQVVALNWRWLFIYPDQHVASLNELDVPVNTPVHFSITADAPMNSFWIPQLGGQVYAMPGMTTQLNLLASKPGKYYGESANISGTGFASMHFYTKALSDTQFKQWVQHARQQPRLDQPLYAQLARNSTDLTITTYRNPQTGLFDGIVQKYMGMSMSMPMEPTQ